MGCSCYIVGTRYALVAHRFHLIQNHRRYSSRSSPTTRTTHKLVSGTSSVTANYLISSFGLSPERAQSASKYLSFQTPEKADSVVSFLQNHGFSRKQISDLVRKRPVLLRCNPQKSLLPKFQFFYSQGISATELAKAFTVNPTILARSLEKQIIPNCNFIKTFLLFDDDYITIFKKYPFFASFNITKLRHNIDLLRQHSIPASNIRYMLTSNPWALQTRPDKFKEFVEEVNGMGFSPAKTQFVVALQTMASMSKLKWRRKLQVYGQWGWSEEATLLAFFRYPWCMMISEEKIMGVMDICVNVMGFESFLVAASPQILSLSLKKRMIPRYGVFEFLLSKGLIKKSINLATLFASPESYFLRKFVTAYEEEAPELMKLYQCKLDLSD